MAPQRMEIGILLVVARAQFYYNIYSMNMSINMPAQRGLSFFCTVNMYIGKRRKLRVLADLNFNPGSVGVYGHKTDTRIK